MTETKGRPAIRIADKSATAFRTIGEVAADLDLPSHVLRFWETKFPQLRPLKRGGGRRYYRPEDIALLRQIRNCLYRDGYTIRGVQKLLDETDQPAAAASVKPPSETPPMPLEPDTASLFPLAPADPPPASAAPRRSSSGSRGGPHISTAMHQMLQALRGELLEIRALIEELRQPGGSQE